MFSFTNYAFYSDTTNITSCARPSLVDCAVANDSVASSDCQLERYGEIDATYFDAIGEFVVDENGWFTFAANDANVALDNVAFMMSCNTSEGCGLADSSNYPITFAVMGGTVLIVDSDLQQVEFRTLNFGDSLFECAL